MKTTNLIFSVHVYELLCLSASAHLAHHVDAMETEERDWMGTLADASGTSVGRDSRLKKSSCHPHMGVFHQTVFVDKRPVGNAICFW